MNVLRRLLRGLVAGGTVVDLTMSPPNETVESGGVILGELDGSVFFPRAAAAGAGLDTLAGEQLLVLEYEEPVTVVVRYPSGDDVLEDIEDRTHTKMPAELARRLAGLDTECLLHSHCLVRRFGKRQK